MPIQQVTRRRPGNGAGNGPHPQPPLPFAPACAPAMGEGELCPGYTPSPPPAQQGRSGCAPQFCRRRPGNGAGNGPHPPSPPLALRQWERGSRPSPPLPAQQGRAGESALCARERILLANTPKRSRRSLTPLENTRADTACPYPDQVCPNFVGGSRVTGPVMALTPIRPRLRYGDGRGGTGPPLPCRPNRAERERGGWGGVRAIPAPRHSWDTSLWVPRLTLA